MIPVAFTPSPYHLNFRQFDFHFFSAGMHRWQRGKSLEQQGQSAENCKDPANFEDYTCPEGCQSSGVRTTFLSTFVLFCVSLRLSVHDIQGSGGLWCDLLGVCMLQDNKTTFHSNVFCASFCVHILQGQNFECVWPRGRSDFLHVQKCRRRRE